MKLLLLILITSTVFAQNAIDVDFSPNYTIEKDSAFYATYSRVKDLYVKRLHTESYQEATAISNDYKKKWRGSYNGTGSELAKDHGGLKWIKANLDKTKFANYEEAIEEFGNVTRAALSEMSANPEFTNAYFDALHKYGRYIYLDLEQEMMREYPEYF